MAEAPTPDAEAPGPDDLATRASRGSPGGAPDAGDREGVRTPRDPSALIPVVLAAMLCWGLLAAGLSQLRRRTVPLMPDFRVAAPEARFSANFTRLGFHPGFGLTTTLPRIVGQQAAARMFYTGERIKGEEAYRMGLADMLVPLEKLRAAAFDFARDLAISAPLAVQSTRATMRQGLAEAVKAATDHELVEQTWLRKTEDFKEGVRAMSERREPNFSGS